MTAVSEATAQAAAGVGDLVNRLAQELAQMQRTLATANTKLASSKRSLEARTQELSEARNSVTLLRATLNCTQDGMLAVARFGRTLHCNARFAEMWRIPADKLDDLNEPALLALQLALVREPERFLAETEQRQLHPDEEHESRVELTDGRILECHIWPQRLHGRRIGTVTAWREVQPATLLS